MEERYFIEIGPDQSVPNDHAIALVTAHYKKLQTKAIEKKTQQEPREKTKRDVGIQCDLEEDERRKMKKQGKVSTGHWLDEEAGGDEERAKV